MIVIFVQSADGHSFLRAFQLTANEAIFPTIVGSQCQSAVGPQLSLGTEAMGCLHQSDQYNGRYTQSIQYYFRLADGKLIAGQCNDASRSLYEGMTVPVFYDAENPTRSIALDCSLTKIA